MKAKIRIYCSEGNWKGAHWRDYLICRWNLQICDSPSPRVKAAFPGMVAGMNTFAGVEVLYRYLFQEPEAETGSGIDLPALECLFQLH
jgi:hypothetical protein